MLEIFQKGGPLMYPILFCSVLALAIFFERVWVYRGLIKQSRRLRDEVELLVRNDHLADALDICRERRTLLAPIYVVALNAAGRSRDQIKTLVEEVGERYSVTLDRYLGLLGTIATLLGLLGTVLGMIRAFTQLAVQGVGTPATLGGGISEALITTATGLSVAIPTILLHKYLTSRSDNIAHQLEIHALDLVDLLAHDTKRS